MPGGAASSLPGIATALAAGLLLAAAQAPAASDAGEIPHTTAGGTGAMPESPPEGPRYWFIGRLSADDVDRTDWLLIRQNILLALYELPDGQSVIWVNPIRGHSGNVHVLSTHPEADGMSCRILRISVDLERGSADEIFRFCRRPDGFWILTAPMEEPDRAKGAEAENGRDDPEDATGRPADR